MRSVQQSAALLLHGARTQATSVRQLQMPALGFSTHQAFKQRTATHSHSHSAVTTRCLQAQFVSSCQLSVLAAPCSPLLRASGVCQPATARLLHPSRRPPSWHRRRWTAPRSHHRQPVHRQSVCECVSRWGGGCSSVKRAAAVCSRNPGRLGFRCCLLAAAARCACCQPTPPASFPPPCPSSVPAPHPRPHLLLPLSLLLTTHTSNAPPCHPSTTSLSSCLHLIPSHPSRPLTNPTPPSSLPPHPFPKQALPPAS